MRTQVVDGVRRRAATFALITLHPTTEVIRPFWRENVRREDARKIGGELFFADIGLRTGSRRFFGTAIISIEVGVAILQELLLRFGSDTHSAFAAGHKAAIYFWFFPDKLWMPAFNHHFLHFIEKLFAHDGRMSPFVYLATVFEMAVVENVGEDESSLLVVHTFTTRASHTVVIEILPYVLISRLVLGVELKSRADEFRFLPVHHDRLSALVVQIAHRSGAGEVSAPRLCSQATSGIYAKIADILIRHTELNGHHQYIIGGIITAVVRYDMRDNAILQKPLNLSTVHGITCEAVNLPTDNPLRLALLYSRHHIVKHGATGLLGGLLLYEYLNDVELFALRKRLQFRQLRLNGEDLLILDIGAFACVEKIAHIFFI